MKQNKIIAMLLLLALCASEQLLAQSSDSLQHYLEQAARNNPTIQADFLAYQASLQKVPQAGAYSDPQLDLGVFLQPMDIIDGKQIANLSVMQMFPWFGTRKAARNEATEMARMSFEKFRESRDNLYLEVKSQWYLLCSLRQRLNNVQHNRELLTHLEQLSMRRFMATSRAGKTAAPTAAPSPSPTSPPTAGGAGGMAGMGSAAPTESMGSKPMGGMGDGGMGSSAAGMSDVLRIQLEMAELDSNIESIESEMRAAEVKFNTLLNRPLNSPVQVPDTMVLVNISMDQLLNRDAMVAQNPMLRMIESEGLSYKAKAEMDKKMSYPMFGLGLQYMFIGKREEMGMPGMSIPVTDMNGKDMIMPMFTLTLPLYRKKYNAQQAESKLWQQAAAEKYASTLNSLEAEHAQLQHQLGDALRKVQLYKKQSDLAQTTYNLIIKEFSAGMSDLSNVIQVQRQLLDYQLKTSEAIANHNTVVASFERLLSNK